ncbi:MAG TPA: thioredoxin domain-containing protein, partial [Pirellulaceae bacterium]|nr:thioredoxin domain-containing protein [Pirellulaceae bacterium]
VPHFEKMLYDNALLAKVYLDGYLATGDALYAGVARHVCDYVLKYMTDATGGFHSTEDADSEGEEGKFYLWTPEEINEILGPQRGRRFCAIYDVTEPGNFEGHNILNLPRPIADWAALLMVEPAELEQQLVVDRARLLEVRDLRIRPGKDDKLIVSWNALMIDALAQASGVLSDERYLTAAQQAADFLLTTLRRADGRLLHSYRTGEAKFDAYLDDYTYLIQALVSLYSADANERWINEAVALADIVLAHFHDDYGGGYYFTADDHEALIARNKDMQDSSVPSASGMLATALLRLGTLCGRQDYLEAARETLLQATGLMEKAPTAAGQLLIAADLLIGPLVELVVVTGHDASAALHSLRTTYLPRSVLAYRAADDTVSNTSHLAPLFNGREAVNGATTLYVCQNFACELPIIGAAAIEKKLKE